ncbi:ATP-binding cassette domain-containing protein [Prevotella sp. S7 MS 2]|uniref:ATP-binding cassette domain-containing protein n=1 Tax=Prevotella sp. S7 MS 2 TaxID=1287488 RepID=UPI000512E5D7|nr:ATP-binding cassette domain-containing protein [Prevotella sp. S7 MS 2]KGI59803.1 ABC transporter ATP-binding protein [Prevotella sp. S7 MS 2]
MEKIKFSNVLPQVFTNRSDIHSDVWKQDVEFQKGHLYLLESESGKGKSTFCSYIVGYRHDYTGEISFDNRSISDFKKKDWVEQRKCHVSHLFQELRLFPELTAYENVEIKNHITAFKTDAQIHDWFERLGIVDKMNTKVGLMSFGQQQRVAFIRALVQPFDFLLADEPISHLDDKNSTIMAEIMLEEAKKQGAGIIVTSIGKHMDMNYERVLRL